MFNTVNSYLTSILEFKQKVNRGVTMTFNNKTGNNTENTTKLAVNGGHLGVCSHNESDIKKVMPK